MTVNDFAQRLSGANRILTPLLWPIAILSIIHRTWFTTGVTDDFTTVFTAVKRFNDGVPVYTENYLTVDPHYLYSPGGTLLLAPMAWLGDYDTARFWFVALQSAAIVAAVVFLFRWLGFNRSDWFIPAVLIALYHSEPVLHTLEFTNVNGSLLLAEVLFLWALLNRREVLAGVLLGLCIAIKPLFAPLLLIPLIYKQWKNIAAAIAVPVVANLVAWPLMVRSSDYFTFVTPYLGEIREYANSSLTGQLYWAGAPELLILLWRGAFGLLVLATVVLLWQWCKSDPFFWASTTAGVLLTGVFLISSLGQQYYSILLLPMIATVLMGSTARTALANVGAGVALFGCFFYGSWILEDPGTIGAWFDVAIVTIAWALLLLTVFASTLRMTIFERFGTQDQDPQRTQQPPSQSSLETTTEEPKVKQNHD